MEGTEQDSGRWEWDEDEDEDKDGDGDGDGQLAARATGRREVEVRCDAVCISG